jgi:hypothetical protein
MAWKGIKRREIHRCEYAKVFETFFESICPHAKK